MISGKRGGLDNFLKRTLSIGFAAGTLLGMGSSAAGAPIRLGARRELFIDHYLIEKLEGARLKLHHPRHAGAAVTYDGPADGVFSFYTTVLKDGDLYRMYYRGYEPGLQAGEDWTINVTCYAESKDGIHWTKPALGIVAVNGSKANNVILPHSAGRTFSPFLDNRPGVPPSERYKANMESREKGREGLLGYVSGDGIHWKLIREAPIVLPSLRNNFDSQNVMFWSEIEQSYVLYARHSEGELPKNEKSRRLTGGIRATARATSDDFLHWSKQTLMTYSDTGSAIPSQHLYTNQTTPYFRAPQIYVSLPGRFQAGRRVLTDAQARAVAVNPAGGGVEDIADGVLLTTRAGSTRYDFTFRESFVRPGIGYNNWTSRNNYPALGVVPTGPAEMSLYVQRNYGQKSAFLERMTLRTDGFVSVNAPYEGGEFTTKAFTFTGKNLEINYATSAGGGMRVEIQDENGVPISGYALEDCPEIIGDEIARLVAWKSGGDVSGLAGKSVRLKFQMKDADLFSFRFRL